MSNICLHEANLSLNIFAQLVPRNIFGVNVLISMQKEVVRQKSYFTAKQI